MSVLVSFEITDWPGIVAINNEEEIDSVVLMPTENAVSVEIANYQEEYKLRLLSFHIGEQHYHVTFELPLDEDKVEGLLEFLHFVRQRMT